MINVIVYKSSLFELMFLHIKHKRVYVSYKYFRKLKQAYLISIALGSVPRPKGQAMITFSTKNLDVA